MFLRTSSWQSYWAKSFKKPVTCDLCQSYHYSSRGMITAVTPRVTHSTPTYSDGKYHLDKLNSGPDMRSWSSRTQCLPGNHFGEETPAPSHRLWVLKSVESSSPSHSPLPSSPFWSLPSASMSPSSHPAFPFSLIPPFCPIPLSTIWRKSQISVCNSAPHLPFPFRAIWEESQLEPYECALQSCKIENFINTEP